MLESSEGCKRPVTSCHFEMLSQILSDRIKIFAVFEGEQILTMFFLTKFDGLALHY